MSHHTHFIDFQHVDKCKEEPPPRGRATHWLSLVDLLNNRSMAVAPVTPCQINDSTFQHITDAPFSKDQNTATSFHDLSLVKTFSVHQFLHDNGCCASHWCLYENWCCFERTAKVVVFHAALWKCEINVRRGSACELVQESGETEKKPAAIQID